MMRPGSNAGSAATAGGDASLVDRLEVGTDLLRGVEVRAVERDRDVVVGRRPHLGHHGLDVELPDLDHAVRHLLIVPLPSPTLRRSPGRRRVTSPYVG